MHEQSLKKFNTDEEYKKWVGSTDWYQTIHLKSGIVTPGKVATDRRIEEFEKMDFAAKSVLDVGCNSGQYCLFAKKKGAARVVGVDVKSRRVHQAKVLALNEGLEIDFHVRGIDEVPTLGKFDIVFCIAVLTEIENVLGGLRILRESIGEQAVIEMGISKPLIYLSRDIRWFKGRDKNVSKFGCTGEFKRLKHTGWVIYPSLEIISDIFGPEFRIEHKGRGIRYDVLRIRKN